MAPTFKHGKGVALLLGGVDMALYVNDSGLDSTVDTADVTTYKTSTGGQSNDRRYVAGHRDSEFYLKGLFDASTGPTAATGGIGGEGTIRGLRALLGSTAPAVTSWGPGGGTVGDYAALLDGKVNEFNGTAPGQDVVKLDSKVQVSGGVRGGAWLHALGAETSTAAQSAVQIQSSTSGTAASSTRGGVAHLHVVACSTLTTLTVKVQHSSDGASWADLITLSATSVGAVRSTVAGTVKEKVRAASTTLSGGAGKTVTYAVAFARHP